MVKTPKKAAPGGDERNMYVRRLKATTTSSSKGCDTNLTQRQRESDKSNRGKPIGAQKRLPVPVAKVFKSKLRSPARPKCSQALENPTRFQPSSNKDENKLAGSTSTTTQDTEISTMYTETEESAVQLKVSITKKELKGSAGKNSSQVDETKEEGRSCVTHSSSNGKEIVEFTEKESTTPRDNTPKEETTGTSAIEATDDKSSTEIHDNGNESSETMKTDVDKAENDHPNFENEEISLKVIDEPEIPKLSEETIDNCTTNGQKDKIIESTEANTCDTGKRSENCSVDVVESTTSEAADTVNTTQSDKEDERITEHGKEETAANDPSFVSYDSSIMLKDVQIKLNDCLKDNSKLFDVSNVEDENSADQQKRLDMSFGKTLRNISGRSTINRLKYVTVRENRFSPNSSLFVNTSSASLDQDDPTNCKFIRYPTDLSDSIICNGSPAERKRKNAETASASAKKLKTEGSSLLSTSLEMLKGIRRPVEVSIANVKGYNFQSDKLNYKTFNDEKAAIDTEVESKKWCVVM